MASDIVATLVQFLASPKGPSILPGNTSPHVAIYDDMAEQITRQRRSSIPYAASVTGSDVQWTWYSMQCAYAKHRNNPARLFPYFDEMTQALRRHGQVSLSEYAQAPVSPDNTMIPSFSNGLTVKNGVNDELLRYLESAQGSLILPSAGKSNVQCYTEILHRVNITRVAQNKKPMTMASLKFRWDVLKRTYRKALTDSALTFPEFDRMRQALKRWGDEGLAYGRRQSKPVEEDAVSAEQKLKMMHDVAGKVVQVSSNDQDARWSHLLSAIDAQLELKDPLTPLKDVGHKDVSRQMQADDPALSHDVDFDLFELKTPENLAYFLSMRSTDFE